MGPVGSKRLRTLSVTGVVRLAKCRSTGAFADGRLFVGGGCGAGKGAGCGIILQRCRCFLQTACGTPSCIRLGRIPFLLENEELKPFSAVNRKNGIIFALSFGKNRVLISCTNRHETIFYKERIEAEKEKTGYDVGMHGGAAGSIYRSDLA